VSVARIAKLLVKDYRNHGCWQHISRSFATTVASACKTPAT